MMSLLSEGKSQANAGLLVVDHQRRIVSLNRKFMELWSIPKRLIAYRDDDQALEFASKQLNEPDFFLQDVREIYEQQKLVIHDTIPFRDGKVLERYSQPQLVEGKIVGRVWKVRELLGVKAER